MNHLTGKFGAFAVAASVTLGIAPAGALASSTFGINARPLRVLYEPGAAESATAVRIQGLIAVPPGTGADFGPPVCGYLYYTCKTGDEALCREQWKDLATAATTGQCVLFSARRDSTGNLAKVPRVRPFDEVPTAPDVYGATTGLGVSTLACGAEFSSTCVLPEGGAGGKSGAAGAGGQGAGGAGGNAPGGNGGSSSGGNAGKAGNAGNAGKPGNGGASGPGGGGTAGPSVGGAGGVMSTGGVVGAGGGGNGGSIATTGSGGISGSGGVGGASAGVDAAVDGPATSHKGGGCAVAGAVSARGALLGGGLLLLVLAARRRARGGR